MSSVTEKVALASVLGLEVPMTSLVMAQENETVVLHLAQVSVDPVMMTERQVSVPLLADSVTC